jgi:hypothetical protein
VIEVMMNGMQEVSSRLREVSSFRHCEERSDEAIQPCAARRTRKNALLNAPAGARLDCFAPLAMTAGAARDEHALPSS